MKANLDIDNIDVSQITLRLKVNGTEWAGAYLPHGDTLDNRLEIRFRDLWEFEEYCHMMSRFRESLYEKLHLQADERVELSNF